MEITNKKIRKPKKILDPEELKQYNKNYYETVGKEKYSKPIKCDDCNCFIKAWTFNKHMISKKHIFNSSCEVEKNQILVNKSLRKQERQLEKLCAKMEAIKKTPIIIE